MKWYRILMALKWVMICAIVLLLGWGLWWGWRQLRSGDEVRIEVMPAKVVDLRAVAELLTTEIIHEATVVDTINGKVIVGVMRQKGSIRYDIEGLPDSIRIVRGDTLAMRDTLRLRLPQERVEILEDTGKGAWRVVDTRSLSLFGSDRMSTEEENRVKRSAVSRTRSRLYRDGTVERSRREAAATLSRTLTLLTGRPVIVTP